MPIRVKCKCGNKFGAPSKYAGKKVKCPECANPLVIPKSNGSAKGETPKVDAAAKKIAVKCKCGKSFGAKPELKGKTVRCPGCKEPIKIGASKTAAGTKKKKTAAKPAAAVDDDVFAEIGFGSGGPGRKCPECKSSMAEEAILCIHCGFNENLGRKMAVERPVTQEDRENAYQEKTLTGGPEKNPKKKKKKKSGGGKQRKGSLILGVILSIMGAAVGSFVWGVIFMFGIEIGLVAMAVGLGAGAGMMLGKGEEEGPGAFIAAGLAIAGIVGTKLAIYFVLVEPVLQEMGDILLDEGEVISVALMFSPFDALWIFLGASTAYKVAAGITD